MAKSSPHKIVKLSEATDMHPLNRDGISQVAHEEQQKNLPKLIPYRKWEDFFEFPKKGVLKYLLLRRKENGFNKCVRVINGRIYLDVESTFNYFDNQREVN